MKVGDKVCYSFYAYNIYYSGEISSLLDLFKSYMPLIITGKCNNDNNIYILKNKYILEHYEDSKKFCELNRFEFI